MPGSVQLLMVLPGSPRMHTMLGFWSELIGSDHTQMLIARKLVLPWSPWGAHAASQSVRYRGFHHSLTVVLTTRCLICCLKWVAVGCARILGQLQAAAGAPASQQPHWQLLIHPLSHSSAVCGIADPLTEGQPHHPRGSHFKTDYELEQNTLKCYGQ